MKKYKIAITGANGQLGSELLEKLQQKYEVIGLTHQDIDVTDADRLTKFFADINPNVVINTAAYHNVPLCEQNPDLAFQVNARGALNLARLCSRFDAVLVHYSTDYVFDGEKKSPYNEDDAVNPLNIYALTKLNGEILIRNYCRRHYILRISGIYGKTPCRAKGGNFITTMLKAAGERDVVKVVTDEILSPTAVSEIAMNTEKLLNQDSYGLFHMTCEGECSWYDFARVIFSELKLTTPLEPCTIDDFPSPVKRPTYSVLENKALKELKLNDMRHWRDVLTEFLQQNYC